MTNNNWEEELGFTFDSNDDSISFFPFGGDSHDFDFKNCCKFIRKVVTAAIQSERDRIIKEIEKLKRIPKRDSPIGGVMIMYLDQAIQAINHPAKTSAEL